MKANELIARLEEQERLLLLEKKHLRDVVAQGLDDSTARWVVDIRRREIIKLRAWLRKLQHDDLGQVDISFVKKRRSRLSVQGAWMDRAFSERLEPPRSRPHQV